MNSRRCTDRKVRWLSCSAGPELALPLRVPDYPWLPGLTIALYVAIIAIFVGTQPELALGGGPWWRR